MMSTSSLNPCSGICRFQVQQIDWFHRQQGRMYTNRRASHYLQLPTSNRGRWNETHHNRCPQKGSHPLQPEHKIFYYSNQCLMFAKSSHRLWIDISHQGLPQKVCRRFWREHAQSHRYRDRSFLPPNSRRYRSKQIFPPLVPTKMSGPVVSNANISPPT